MARIRTIKPEFWGDEKLAPMDPLTRLVFLGLISMADDAGRLLDSVKQIDAMLFPFTDDTSREALANLSRAGRVERGMTASGQRIIQIVNWHHQKVDHPNLRAALPPIAQRVTDDSRGIRENLASNSREIRDSISTSDLRPVPTTNDRRPGGADAPAPPPKRAKSVKKPLPPWAGPLAAQWERRIGHTSPEQIAGKLRSVADVHGEAPLLRAIDAYADARLAAGKPCKLEWFASEASVWVSRAAPLVDPETGLLNERGMAVAGAAL